jgi:pimeloyl-ACP methyl ester carboxylesterase
MAISAPRPFTVQIPDAAVQDLRDRLCRTRWPDRETVDDWSQGVPLGYVQELCAYWADDYDWRAAEQRLHAYPQFMLELFDLDIHFLHVRSPVEDALPLVITHGWPGSVVEFLNVLDRLTNPKAHGGSDDDAFHVVCPSLAGYGFSGKPARPGWSVERIADAWARLMAALGYDRYGAQGGDWGAAVTTAIGQRDPSHVAGIHLNMPMVGPDRSTMNELTDAESSALDALAYYQEWDSGYSKQQSTRPQTLGYGLADSPAGQCAWIIEKFWAWTDCDGHPENAVSRDSLLDNVSLYWFTNSAASSARLYWESFNRQSREVVGVPTGCSIFPKEIFRASRRWAERRFIDLRYWNELDKGGHFAALEQPELYVDELRAFFRLVR